MCDLCRSKAEVWQITHHEIADVNDFFKVKEVIFTKNNFASAKMVEAIKEIIPNFEHVEMGKNLDQKMSGNRIMGECR